CPRRSPRHRSRASDTALTCAPCASSDLCARGRLSGALCVNQPTAGGRSVKRLVPFLAVLALVVGPALCAGTGVARAADTKPAKPAKTDAKAPAVTPAVTDSLGLLERAVAKDSTKFDNLYKLGFMYLDREQNAEAAR